jgi:hypothetical protein
LKGFSIFISDRLLEVTNGRGICDLDREDVVMTVVLNPAKEA